jgi:hypothetical protein
MKLNIGNISSRLEEKSQLIDMVKSIRTGIGLSINHHSGHIVSNVVLPPDVTSLVASYLGNSIDFIQRFDGPLPREARNHTAVVVDGTRSSPAENP